AVVVPAVMLVPPGPPAGPVAHAAAAQVEMASHAWLETSAAAAVAVAAAAAARAAAKAGAGAGASRRAARVRSRSTRQSSFQARKTSRTNPHLRRVAARLLANSERRMTP